MSAEWFRELCLALPHVTEHVQWGSNLVFKVGGRIFAIMALEPGGGVFSFKCSPESYAELIEIPGIVPAPYLARASWVSFETPDVLPRAEVKNLVRIAHELVFSKLTRKVRAALAES